MDDKQNLIASLAQWSAAGKLDIRLVLPAIQSLSGGVDTSLFRAFELIEKETEPDLVSLAVHLRTVLKKEALRIHDQRKRAATISDEDRLLLEGLTLQPIPEWKLFPDSSSATVTQKVTRTAREFSFVSDNQRKAPELFCALTSSLEQDLLAAYAVIGPIVERLSTMSLEQMFQSWPADMAGRTAFIEDLRRRRRGSGEEHFGVWLKDLSDGLATHEPDRELLLTSLIAKFDSAQTRAEKGRILDLICSWPTPALVAALNEVGTEDWAQHRAVLALTLRFGQPVLDTWAAWLDWLGVEFKSWQTEQEIFSRIIETDSVSLLLILYSGLPQADPETQAALLRIVAESSPPITVEEVLQSRAKSVPIQERRALLGIPEPVPPPLPPIIAPTQPQPPPIPLEQIEPPALPPQRPRRPSLWEQHIQPLFVENWYIVAGIVMVILGSSLLAYYTWDKHWLVRYTIMPALLAVFTWSLAGAGRWIEKKGNEFRTTAAILRGAAIGLLPINFMTMALLSADEKVPQKGPALLVMAALYLAVFGWGLKRWCSAVEPSGGNVLAGSLLLLNALVAVGPLARTLGHLPEQQVLWWLGAGFYFGFIVAAWTVVHFSRRILTREMAEEKRVPWFVAAALAITYLQVFIWVHGFMRHLPQAQTYALLVIMIGWLVLYVERRALQLRETPELHGGESFLGFAFILLGLLMSFTSPQMRIAAFAISGAIWLYQALFRRHALHYWIGLTLLGLAGASVGLLSSYPKPWLPLLGVLLTLGFGIGASLVRKLNRVEIRDACRGMQVVALVLTAIVAPLAQWHYRSQPLLTALWLGIVASIFAWRALADRKLHWLHASMLVLALVLPYAGFVDMAGRTAHHNTMPFGLALLSWLWLGITWRARSARPISHVAIQCPELPAPGGLLLQARSTILVSYGALAIAAMLLRVVLADVTPTPLWYRDYMDYLGPILVTLALIPATHFSRSLIPAGMAVVIMAILFPELRANLQLSMPWWAWGTGLGSASWGLALASLCFILRRWRFLQNLPVGDRFLGREPFPLRRHDHTLFTWPVLLAVLFLTIKVDTWNLLRNLSTTGVPLKTAVALGITGGTWNLLAVYNRLRERAVSGVYIGWLCILAGIGLGYWHEAADPYWAWPFLSTGLLLQACYWICRFLFQPNHGWVKDLLTEPARLILMLGSAFLSIVAILLLLQGEPLQSMLWLYAFLAAQLMWHGLAIRNYAFGTILFFFVWFGILAASASGPGGLWERVTINRSLNPTLWMLLIIQLAFITLEFASVLGGPEARKTSLHDRLSPALTPSFAAGSAMAFLLGLLAIADGAFEQRFSLTQQCGLIVLLLLTARAHVSGLILLGGIFLGYVTIHYESISELGRPWPQIQLLATPWRLALLSLAMVLLGQGIRELYGRRAEIVAGRFALRFFKAPSVGWLFWPALLLCTGAAIYHTFDPTLRESAAQLWAPYLGAIVFGLIAFTRPQSNLFAGTGLLLLLGNILLLRVFLGELLRRRGLSELHLVCLGIALTLLQATVLRWRSRSAPVIAVINLVSLGLAGSILLLLSANYFTEPGLATMTSTRFIVSGLLAWVAGRYFRRAARHPGPGEEAHADQCEAFYHFGVVLAIWCGALLIPWFRKPLFTLIALGLPAGYFYLRAEVDQRQGRPQFRRYRNSAAVLGFSILGLYAFKGVFHLVLFPGAPVGTEYYHYNSVLIMMLGLLLLRLQGLGGTIWLAFYGGLALMVGSYFLVTTIPGFSPFHFPMPAAWCAVALAHFWLLLVFARSPVRTFLQRLSKLEEPVWQSLRRSWSICLLVAAQTATAWGLLDFSANTYMVAPLLAAAATVFLHLGILQVIRIEDAARSAQPNAPGGIPPELGRVAHGMAWCYFIFAAVEFVMALHMDFLVPSYLPKEQIIWAILLLWFGLLIVYHFAPLKIPPAVVRRLALCFAALVMAYVIYHRPWSNVGLWGVMFGAILGALTPQRDRQARNPGEQLCAALLLCIPAWLVFFSQAPFELSGPDAALKAWPILATTATIFVTGLFARLFPTHLAAAYHRQVRKRFCLFDCTLTWLECVPRFSVVALDLLETTKGDLALKGARTVGARIYQSTLWLTLIIVIATQILHYNTAFSQRELALLFLLEIALTIAWYHAGKERESMLAYFVMQLAVAAAFATLRRHLMLTTQFWTYEYDVWASLAFSFGLAGAKQVFELRPRSFRLPLLSTMCALPVLALVWVLVHGLGANMALLVVGMNSVMFAYLGKEDRESPYNVVALAGFVAFILLTFYSKLHLRAVHAYVIPVGLGVLILQELFRNRTPPEARNGIRLVTLMAMLGSSGYYALADLRYPITFNFTMILLCLLSMGLGSFLRIRLYLAMGFAGLMVDLISILYKVLIGMERNSRMTVIGSLVLVIGAALVFGAIYYKTNKEKLDAWLNRWRVKFGAWE